MYTNMCMVLGFVRNTRRVIVRKCHMKYFILLKFENTKTVNVTPFLVLDIDNHFARHTTITQYN